MKQDDLAEVTKLYCARIYNGDTCAKALFVDAELIGNSNPFLCLGVYEPQQRCDLDTETYNLSRLIPGKASRFLTVLEMHTLLMDRRNTVSQNGESGVTNCGNCRSQWPHCLRRGFATAFFLGLRVSITSGGGGRVCLSLVSAVCCRVEVSASG
jgi:hypothetical protein